MSHSKEQENTIFYYGSESAGKVHGQEFEEFERAQPHSSSFSRKVHGQTFEELERATPHRSSFSNARIGHAYGRENFDRATPQSSRFFNDESCGRATPHSSELSNYQVNERKFTIDQLQKDSRRAPPRSSEFSAASRFFHSPIVSNPGQHSSINRTGAEAKVTERRKDEGKDRQNGQWSASFYETVQRLAEKVPQLEAKIQERDNLIEMLLQIVNDKCGQGANTPISNVSHQEVERPGSPWIESSIMDSMAYDRKIDNSYWDHVQQPAQPPVLSGHTRSNTRDAYNTPYYRHPPVPLFSPARIGAAGQTFRQVPDAVATAEVITPGDNLKVAIGGKKKNHLKAAYSSDDDADSSRSASTDSESSKGHWQERRTPTKKKDKLSRVKQEREKRKKDKEKLKYKPSLTEVQNVRRSDKRLRLKSQEDYQDLHDALLAISRFQVGWETKWFDQNLPHQAPDSEEAPITTKARKEAYMVIMGIVNENHKEKFADFDQARHMDVQLLFQKITRLFGPRSQRGEFNQVKKSVYEVNQYKQNFTVDEYLARLDLRFQAAADMGFPVTSDEKIEVMFGGLSQHLLHIALSVRKDIKEGKVPNTYEDVKTSLTESVQEAKLGLWRPNPGNGPQSGQRRLDVNHLRKQEQQLQVEAEDTSTVQKSKECKHKDMCCDEKCGYKHPDGYSLEKAREAIKAKNGGGCAKCNSIFHPTEDHNLCNKCKNRGHIARNCNLNVAMVTQDSERCSSPGSSSEEDFFMGSQILSMSANKVQRIQLESGCMVQEGSPRNGRDSR